MARSESAYARIMVLASVTLMPFRKRKRIRSDRNRIIFRIKQIRYIKQSRMRERCSI